MSKQEIIDHYQKLINKEKSRFLKSLLEQECKLALDKGKILTFSGENPGECLTCSG